jgi:hypothetical protein
MSLLKKVSKPSKVVSIYKVDKDEVLYPIYDLIVLQVDMLTTGQYIYIIKAK